MKVVSWWEGCAAPSPKPHPRLSPSGLTGPPTFAVLALPMMMSVAMWKLYDAGDLFVKFYIYLIVVVPEHDLATSDMSVHLLVTCRWWGKTSDRSISRSPRVLLFFGTSCQCHTLGPRWTLLTSSTRNVKLDFYRAVLCLPVCRCVLSHAGLNGYAYKFSQSATQFWFFHTNQTGWQYSDGDPPNCGVEYMGVWKNHDFRPISRFISETMQDRVIVTMEG